MRKLLALLILFAVPVGAQQFPDAPIVQITYDGGSSSNPFLGPDGTAALPTYAFSNANDTGMYLSAGSLVWSYDGAAEMSFDTINGLQVNDWVRSGITTCANPGLSFIGDSDTGLCRPSAAHPALASNGNIILEGDLTLGIRFATTSPTCDSSARGYFKRTEGGAGVADTLEICAKNSSDTYAWYALASIP